MDMTKKADLDVVIPVYNGAAFVADAINSVLNQTIAPSAIIVVDDASTDDTSEVLGKLSGHIQCVRHDKNRGLPSARNTGIKAGSSELIAFLDADDVWTKDKLEKQLKIFQKYPQTGLCYTDLSDCDIELQPIKSCRSFRNRNAEYVFEELFMDAFPMPPSTVIVRREVFRLCDFFNESMLKAQDYECWLRIGMLYPVSCIPEVLCLRRNNPSSITNTSTLEKALFYTYKTFELCGEAAKKWNIPLPMSIDERKKIYLRRRYIASCQAMHGNAKIFFKKRLIEIGEFSNKLKLYGNLLKSKGYLKTSLKKSLKAFEKLYQE
jgi:glycosyltransferase involved in cell wall biosynthesis